MVVLKMNTEKQLEQSLACSKAVNEYRLAITMFPEPLVYFLRPYYTMKMELCFLFSASVQYLKHTNTIPKQLKSKLFNN